MSDNIDIKAFIGLGSNLGNGKATLQGAWQALGETQGIVLDGLSSPYMSAPVDMTSQHWFTNAVGRLKVSLTPIELLRVLLAVEASFGRSRSEKTFGYQDRSLDLDLLYFGDLVMDSPELILPHPRISDRLFVLAPFVELDPNFTDCGSGETIAAMERHLRENIAADNIENQEIICASWNVEPNLLNQSKNEMLD